MTVPHSFFICLEITILDVENKPRQQMTGDLLINGTDAYTAWGVHMGQGFVSTIDAPAPLKDFAKNVSRAEHGSRYVVPTSAVYKAEREVTLPFVIMGETEADFRSKRDAFLAVLEKGKVTINVPTLSTTYTLIYTGKSVTYSLNTARTIAKFQAKFIEPDPSSRVVASAVKANALNFFTLAAMDEGEVDINADETEE